MGNRGERQSGAGRFPRRAFIGAAATAGAALLLPVGLRRHGGFTLDAARSRAAGGDSFDTPLPIPEVLTGEHIRIPIREARVQILPGRKTHMWTYGGTFPGPTIRRPAGQETRVTFVNKLPSSAGELSVHLHGGHTPTDDDGQPGGLTKSYPKSMYCKISPNLSAQASGNDVLIAPGARRTYTYPLVEDGAPERAAFQWYHDHRLDHTSKNVWKGLAGMFIIDDDFEAGLNLPSGEFDIPLLIADRSFNSDNQLTHPFGFQPPDDGVTGKLALVNGAYRPYHRVEGRRYRIRLLNASNFRAYELYLSTGEPLLQIATESGLMPKAVKRDSILLAPAERAEVVIDFKPHHGKNVELLSRRSDRAGLDVYGGPVMQFRVGGRASDPSTDPSTLAELRPLPDWAAPAKAAWQSNPVADQTWKINLGGTFFPVWQINGNTFDPARVDYQATLGDTDIWRIQNKSDRTHIFHIHMTDWYMLERNGRGPRPWEDCLKESFLVRPRDEVVVAGHLSDHLGKFVVHCHMLDHEDHGLMDQYEVVAPV